MALTLEEKRKHNRECQRNRRAKKYYLGDLTYDQSLEIVNLVFPFDRTEKSEIEVKHFNGDFGEWVDLRESNTRITFKVNVRNHLPNTTDEVVIIIYPTLDISCYYKIKDEKTNIVLHRVHNQYRIQKKFEEWKILPKFVFD